MRETEIPVTTLWGGSIGPLHTVQTSTTNLMVGQPGNLIIWRGLARTTDMHFGFFIAQQIMGK